MTDSYRPQYRAEGGPPAMPAAARDAMYRFQGNPEAPRGPRGFQSGPRNRPSQNQRFSRPGAAHLRPLLRLQQNADDRSFVQPSGKSKFRNVDDITDSDEDEMSQSDEDDEELRPAKRLRTDAIDSQAAASTPKWSNPDPYTALPPPTEATGKRTDVVQLIRKAKISDDTNQAENDLAKNEDFISFDGGFDDQFPDVPRGPKADGLDHLGKRKRDDSEARPRRPGGYLRTSDDAPILREWAASGFVNSTPWLSRSPTSDSAATALHKEIIDFYEWVRPQDYEAEVREDILRRLSLSFNQIESGVLKAFGSYAAGLYLPTGDMDLVFLQHGFRPGQTGKNGLPPPPSRSLLNKFARRLNRGLARPGSVQLIPWAKVPIVKFVDQVSGIRVDLSFNNDTGITANETFQKWKSQYPAMPILVSIIKQFLMLRGLNDVATGGLGGFSIICLVTSLVQHMPGANPPSNLGQMLVEFLNMYGDLIDKETVAIRLDPPGYIDKATYKPHLFSKESAGRLTIIDPNRPENNISGGTTQIDTIFSCFSSTYDLLQSRLESFADDATNKDNFSFLKDIVGGNFAAYENQRRISKDLYFGLTGRQVVEQPPAPPPPSRQPPKLAPPPPPPPGNDGVKTASRRQPQSEGTPSLTAGRPRTADETQQTKGERRANRLRLARPDLTRRVKTSISAKAAVKMGGYQNADALERDLKIKEAAMGIGP